MTQSTTTPVDPFAAAAEDPFGQPSSGGGARPKPADLIGALIMLTPVKVEQQPKYRGKPGETQDRLTADTVVLAGAGDWDGQSFDEMWWTNSPIVKAGQSALRKGQKMILGTLRRFPINEDVKAGTFAQGDWKALEAALETWAKNPMGSDKPSFAIALDQYTDEDAAKARDYLKKNVKPV